MLRRHGNALHLKERNETNDINRIKTRTEYNWKFCMSFLWLLANLKSKLFGYNDVSHIRASQIGRTWTRRYRSRIPIGLSVGFSGIFQTTGGQNEHFSNVKRTQICDVMHDTFINTFLRSFFFAKLLFISCAYKLWIR